MTLPASRSPTAAELPSAEALKDRLDLVFRHAQRHGASAAEASVSASRGLSVNVRQDAIESLEFQQDRELGLTVYLRQRKGHATTGDWSDAGIAEAVDAALAIAAATGEDPCNGLADAALMALPAPDLDLDHPWHLDADAAVDLARTCEAAAFAADSRITGSEGAGVSSHRGISAYANTHGFFSARLGTRHSLSCAVVASAGDDMQRDYWYSNSRVPAELMAPDEIGRMAGHRAAARLGARKLDTRRAPVLFPPELARGIWGHFVGAISGSALYRKATFLLDQLGKDVFSSAVSLRQSPHLLRASGSAFHDSEGVATQDRVLVDRGRLDGWLLGSYSARKLGLVTTGNAGGVFNLVVEPGPFDFEALLRQMGRGLLVTELLGHGVNAVTGDYSRGAAGFWVENGEIAYPVDELTIAGNLAEMFKAIVAVGSDVDIHANTHTGSLLIDGMTIAGH
ncbi:metalloprotease PmbA [Solimonas terrae]|uniref:Metalloprotease PmbA n=1 Tax=Solimonas terrae TaxID=1396819 RepID=A0A6M2BRN9_9GAMM|nr:metalloprotease PmbA [Solimonas terrae]NGY05302.1 metalloprotease PmbA [Solimonas terrae]